MNQCRVGLLTIAIAFLPILHGQVAGSITGKVEDASGGPISAASVTVKSLETGATPHHRDRRQWQFHGSAAARLVRRKCAPKRRDSSPPFAPASISKWASRRWSNLRLEVGELVQQVAVSPRRRW